MQIRQSIRAKRALFRSKLRTKTRPALLVGVTLIGKAIGNAPGLAGCVCVSVATAFILSWPFGVLVAGALLLAIDLAP